MTAGRLPTFFIVGAPKCGTTSMSRWLSEHPAVFMSTPKEPHFFNTDLGNRKAHSIEEYRGLFDAVSPAHEEVGEASTWYLFSEDAVPGIERAISDPLYIVMSRDPIRMAQSLFVHNRRCLYEDACSLERAWELQELRSSGEAVPRRCPEPQFLQYRRVCSVGEQLDRMLDSVPPERVLHLRVEDLADDPATEYRRVLDFLDLAPDGRTDFAPENVAREPKSVVLQRLLLAAGRIRRRAGIRKGWGLLRLNERPIEKQSLPPHFRERLVDEFAEDRALLSRLDGRLR